MDKRSDSDMRAPDGSSGRVLIGKDEYRLVRLLGRGGMGEVWAAERRKLRGAPVAVKLMTVPATPRARARFDQEASSAALLSSSHVVQIIDHDVDATTGAHFIVMEHLAGENLRHRLRHLKKLTPVEVGMMATHVGHALSCAHEGGIVHRDLKPDNIFYDRGGVAPIVKVLDFGLAKMLGRSAIDPRALTVPGMPVGTPWYMSPEQIRGETEDHFSDLWALAVIACECLTGRLPFYSHHLATLERLLSNPVRPVPSKLGDVPRGFDEWFAIATAVDIEQRFQSAEELVDALVDVCGTARQAEIPSVEQERLSTPPLPTLTPVTSESGIGARPRRRRLLGVVSAAFSLALGLTAYYVGVYRPQVVSLRTAAVTNAAPTVTAALPTTDEAIDERASLPTVAPVPQSEPLRPEAPASAVEPAAPPVPAEPPIERVLPSRSPPRARLDKPKRPRAPTRTPSPVVEGRVRLEF